MGKILKGKICKVEKINFLHLIYFYVNPQQSFFTNIIALLLINSKNNEKDIFTLYCKLTLKNNISFEFILCTNSTSASQLVPQVALVLSIHGTVLWAIEGFGERGHIRQRSYDTIFGRTVGVEFYIFVIS